VKMREPCVFPNSVRLKSTALFSVDAIDVHRTIAALGSYIFVKRVPSYALNVMSVLCYLVHTLPCVIEQSHFLCAL
jgi:hypothetical protein